jgi:phosphoribosylamine---glycine ligase
VRVLVIDPDRTGLDCCYRAAVAGHEVRWWVPPNKDRSPVRTGDGFVGVQRVASWQQNMVWAKSGLVINLYNDQKITAELDKYRAFGFPVFGPTSKSAELEINRGKGMKCIEDHGIEVPKYHSFPTLDAALAFAWKADQPYVFKTLGDEEDKSLSYVASDPADLVGWILMKKQQGLKLKGPCMLQEKIDMICEVGVSAWMGKDGFLPYKFNINFEHKKLMPGDFGQNTGEMGTVCKYVDDGVLCDMLMKFEDHFMSLGHRGDTDIGCGIDSKGRIWPFEFSMRMGWPSTFILMASHKGDPVEWMRDSLDGIDSLEVDTRCSMGVVMAMPPFPKKNEDPRSSIGYVVDGLEQVWEHVSPVELMIEKGPVMQDGAVAQGPVYKTTGDYVCVVTALAPDVHDVIPECYSAVDRIRFCDRIVRNDIGARLEKELPKLHALGFTEMPHW